MPSNIVFDFYCDNIYNGDFSVSPEITDIQATDCTFIDCEINLETVSFQRCTFRNCKITAQNGSFLHCLITQSTIEITEYFNAAGCTIVDPTFQNILKTFNIVDSTINRAVFSNCRPEKGLLNHSTVFAKEMSIDRNNFSALTTENDNILNENAANLGFPISQVCPREGPFIGYKKLRGNLIATLFIPVEAERVGSLQRKCRASKAQVVSILDLDKGKCVQRGISLRDPQFIYSVGATVYPDAFDADPNDLCGEGIHFFMTMEEAIKYEGYLTY